MAKKVIQFSRFVNRINNKLRKISNKKNPLPYRTINVLMAISSQTTIGKMIEIPYDRHRVFDDIISNPIVNFKLKNSKYLAKILKVAEGWIGSHVHSLEDYILETREGHDENNELLEWPICGGNCNTQGLGYCGSWCLGGSCSEVSWTDQYGNKVGTGQNHYEAKLTIWT